MVASATRNGRRLIAVVLGAYSGAVRAQKAAQLLERGFNSGGLSWLTPSLGTVDALAPIDAQPPNLREEMCGGHRRKPAAEDNDEEEPTPGTTRPAASGEAESAAGLHAVQPEAARTANSCSGRRSRPSAPVVVFTGPADHPDAPCRPPAPRAEEEKEVAGQAGGQRRPARPKPPRAEAGEADQQAKQPHKPKVSRRPTQ